MQRTALFELPASVEGSPVRSSAEWRALFVAGGVGTLQDWNLVRVVAVRNQLWIIPGSPAANTWIEAHLDGIAAVVADAVEASVTFQYQPRQIGVRHGLEKLWAYRIPRYVAVKDHAWNGYEQPLLSVELRDAMARKIERSLRKELTAWDRLPHVLDDEQPFLMIARPGRPLFIPAIGAAPAARDKPITVLVRADVLILSHWRFEGDLFAGPLPSLGYGRLLRASPPEQLTPEQQSALLKLPIPSMEDF